MAVIIDERAAKSRRLSSKAFIFHRRSAGVARRLPMHFMPRSRHTVPPDERFFFPAALLNFFRRICRSPKEPPPLASMRTRPPRRDDFGTMLASIISARDYIAGRAILLERRPPYSAYRSLASLTNATQAVVEALRIMPESGAI